MIIYKKLTQYYKVSAIIWLNTCMLILLVNIVIFLVDQIEGLLKEKNPVSAKYGQILEKVYPNLTEEKIGQLLRETWSRPYVYEPFTQFKERPYTGKYVNVDENGFRITKNQGPWPHDQKKFNVFLFGGSTAFGYGVPDDQTIASYLQEFLDKSLRKDVRVYNFARSHYYSTQELILFERLLSSGFVPDMAIFIDGLNDFYYNKDEPLHTDRFKEFVEGKTNPQILEKIPMIKAIQSWQKKIAKIVQKHSAARDKNNEAIYDDKSIIKRVIDRYIRNKKLIEAISSVYGIKPVFVWQPVPFYKYDLKYHPFAKKGFKQHTYAKFGYPYMAEFIKNPLGNNFLWCADMQEKEKEPLYVDIVHYSAKMSKKLGSTIYGLLLARNLLPTGN